MVPSTAETQDTEDLTCSAQLQAQLQPADEVQKRANAPLLALTLNLPSLACAQALADDLPPLDVRYHTACFEPRRVEGSCRALQRLLR